MAEKAKFKNATARNVAKRQTGFTYDKPELLWKYNEDGSRELEQVGTIDTYLATQADAEQCNVANILRRATLGEEDLLHKVNGIYADTTLAPKNLMMAQNMALRAEKTFYELPKEIRESFSNDVNKFMAEYGTKDFFGKIKNAITPKEKKVEVKKEVTE